MTKLRRTLAGVLVVGLAAASFTIARATDGSAMSEAADCTACDCIAPEVCGDREEICPAGPDCWMPELCPDRTVVCPPSDPEPAVE